MAEKLTKAQRLLLERARHGTLSDDTGQGAYIWGRHAMRTANVLQDRGLIAIGVLHYAKITDAGRAALQSSEAQPIRAEHRDSTGETT